MTELEERFLAAATALGAKHHGGDVFRQLHTAYADEPQRHYHTLEHIRHCLSVLDTIRENLTSPAHVEMAIWFHDVIYNMPDIASRNEEDSAEFAYGACLRMGIGGATAEQIANMVRATKKHEVVKNVLPDENDFQAFLDIDLAILGTDPLSYAQFEKDIHQEYAWLPDLVYRTGRTAVLSRFDDRGSIYRCPPLNERFEKAARRNLRSVLYELHGHAAKQHGHATADVFFLTTQGRLVETIPWNNLEFVDFIPQEKVIELRFERRYPSTRVHLDEPPGVEVIEHLRSLPTYGHNREALARSEGTRQRLYERGKRSPYRG